MEKALIIFGNITFDELTDGTSCAIIHEVHDTLSVKREAANEIGDQLVNLYDSYIIPSMFDGKIIWEH
jgi:hypothetical protein